MRRQPRLHRVLIRGQNIRQVVGHQRPDVAVQHRLGHPAPGALHGRQPPPASAPPPPAHPQTPCRPTARTATAGAPRRHRRRRSRAAACCRRAAPAQAARGAGQAGADRPLHGLQLLQPRRTGRTRLQMPRHAPACEPPKLAVERRRQQWRVPIRRHRGPPSRTFPWRPRHATAGAAPRRARDSRDITVPTGVPVMSAMSR